jgi:hypothetical protein
MNKFINDFGKVEDVSDSWIYVAFFGPLYFAYKRNWEHFIIYSMCYVFGSLICGYIAVLVWAFYVIFARYIMREFYLKSGWSEYYDF